MISIKKPPHDLPLSLPSTTSLRCFESAARHQSYTAAAQELCTTQSAVSKTIKELEKQLGIRLFLREGRGVTLTPAGQRFAEDVAKDLANLQRSVHKAVSAGDSGIALSVATLPTFANHWLIPRLPDFFARHPAIQLNLSTRLNPFAFDEEPFDLAFHYGIDNWPNTRMVRLFGESMVPVCSSAFYRKHQLDNVNHHLTMPLLHLQSRPFAWRDWFAKTHQGDTPSLQGQHLDQHSMVLAAAVAGLGAAILPQDFITQHLEDGTLQRIDGPHLTTEKSYYLVLPIRGCRPRTQAFEQWVRSWAQPVE